MNDFQISGSEGMRLNFRVWGRGPPRFFLIHGFGDGAFVWHHLADALTRYGSSVAVDLRGHGDSDRDPHQLYSHAANVTDVMFSIDQLELSASILVGHSMGANIAIEIAATRPDRVKALVIIEGGPGLNPDARMHVGKEFSLQPWEYESVKEYEELLAERLPLASSESLRPFAQSALRMRSVRGFELKCDRAMARVLDGADDMSMWALLPLIPCPVLVVRGGVSAMLSDTMARRIARSLRKCRFETVPLAGHATMLDNPPGLFAVVERFVIDGKLWQG